VGLVALGVAIGVLVAVGELLVAGLVVAVRVGAVPGCEVFDVGAGAVGAEVADAPGEAVGDAVGVVVTPLLATVKRPRRLEVVPSDHVNTALMVCGPLASFVVSNGRAVPSVAVPAKSKGGTRSVRTGGFVRRLPSR
ncbi:MAG: hypothetical protein ABW318_16145, partial [Vicinamibacterales bacterium]